MGAKQGRNIRSESAASLNPNERRRLTAFLVSKGTSNQFTAQDMTKLWKNLLVPELLKCYVDFLMKQDTAKKNYIGVDEFVFIYSTIVRGEFEDKARTIAEIVGLRKDSSGKNVISFNGLCKYLSDVLESYFLQMREGNDANYKSWTHLRHPQRHAIEQIMKGVCFELPRKSDEVQVHEMEQWLNYTGVISVLHSYVLGSMYNLEPELKATIVPCADFPTSKTSTILDLSQIVYLNSYVPSENKAKWRFLFSTNTHGESFSKLVGCISNQGPILIIVESEDNSIFGGFVSESIAPGPRWVGTGDCFLFKLTPSVEVFSASAYNNHYVYLNTNQSSLPNGLGMGGQYNYWGLWIDSHFGNGECSESCTTYKNYNMLNNKKKFHIKNVEVWGVGEPPPTAEELGERTTEQMTSALDKDAAASHIMEMAGRKTYSKGLRGSPPK